MLNLLPVVAICAVGVLSAKRYAGSVGAVIGIILFLVSAYLNVKISSAIHNIYYCAIPSGRTDLHQEAA